MKLSNVLMLGVLMVQSFFLSGCVEVLETVRVDHGSLEVRSEEADVHIGFGYHDRRTIQRYYPRGRRKHHKGLPPGLAKKRKLPPGLAKRLEKGGHLPPGLNRDQLPADLEVQLTPLPKKYIRLKVGGSVVILNQETDVVIDIVRDIE